MPYKDVEKRKEAIRKSMKKLRGMMVIGDVNPDDVNPCDEECEPLEERMVYPNYDIHPKHRTGCVCMLCSPNKWPDLKVQFEKHKPIKHEGGRKIYPNYDIHPAHAGNCDCMCCLGGVTGRDGKFKLMKDMLASI